MSLRKMRILTLFILIITYVFEPINMSPIFTEVESTTGTEGTVPMVETSETYQSKDPNAEDQSTGYFAESFHTEAVTEDKEIKESTFELESLKEDIHFTVASSNLSESHTESLSFSNSTNDISGTPESETPIPTATDENGAEKILESEKTEKQCNDTVKLDESTAPILSISFSISDEKKSQINIMMNEVVDELSSKKFPQSFPTYAQNSLFFLFNFGNLYYINGASTNDNFSGHSGESDKNSSTSEKASELGENDEIPYSNRSSKVDDSKDNFHEQGRKVDETTLNDSSTNEVMSNTGTHRSKPDNEVADLNNFQNKNELLVGHRKVSVIKGSSHFIDTNDQVNESDDEDYIILEGSGWYNDGELKPLENNWYQKLRMKREL